ncbi:hypothetical protein RclHR1_11980006 [Rhizophagus clarus]|uniref:Uncharacterized protein n=1 Tax=Rhizophagus clarus TaxID=94130 RepID=A0A2Z6QXP7_9GLOM|nr:hypothetical protein RclHR1_11980006 [Rhizophagus clarus]
MQKSKFNINEQESSKDNNEDEQDQKSSDTEILDSESPGYEPIFQEFSDNSASDCKNSELSTDDSNSVLSTSTQNESNQDSENENANIQLPPGFPEALRLLEIKSHSNMTNNMYREIIEAFSEQHVSLYLLLIN